MIVLGCVILLICALLHCYNHCGCSGGDRRLLNFYPMCFQTYLIMCLLLAALAIAHFLNHCNVASIVTFPFTAPFCDDTIDGTNFESPLRFVLNLSGSHLIVGGNYLSFLSSIITLILLYLIETFLHMYRYLITFYGRTRLDRPPLLHTIGYFGTYAIVLSSLICIGLFYVRYLLLCAALLHCSVNCYCIRKQITLLVSAHNHSWSGAQLESLLHPFKIIKSFGQWSVMGSTLGLIILFCGYSMSTILVLILTMSISSLFLCLSFVGNRESIISTKLYSTICAEGRCCNCCNCCTLEKPFSPSMSNPNSYSFNRKLAPRSSSNNMNNRRPIIDRSSSSQHRVATASSRCWTIFCSCCTISMQKLMLAQSIGDISIKNEIIVPRPQLVSANSSSTDPDGSTRDKQESNKSDGDTPGAVVDGPSNETQTPEQDDGIVIVVDGGEPHTNEPTDAPPPKRQIFKISVMEFLSETYHQPKPPETSPTPNNLDVLSVDTQSGMSETPQHSRDATMIENSVTRDIPPLPPSGPPSPHLAPPNAFFSPEFHTLSTSDNNLRIPGNGISMGSLSSVPTENWDDHSVEPSRTATFLSDGMIRPKKRIHLSADMGMGMNMSMGTMPLWRVSPNKSISSTKTLTGHSSVSHSTAYTISSLPRNVTENDIMVFSPDFATLQSPQTAEHTIAPSLSMNMHAPTRMNSFMSIISDDASSPPHHMANSTADVFGPTLGPPLSMGAIGGGAFRPHHRGRKQDAHNSVMASISALSQLRYNPGFQSRFVEHGNAGGQNNTPINQSRSRTVTSMYDESTSKVAVPPASVTLEGLIPTETFKHIFDEDEKTITDTKKAAPLSINIEDVSTANECQQPSTANKKTRFQMSKKQRRQRDNDKRRKQKSDNVSRSPPNNKKRQTETMFEIQQLAILMDFMVKSGLMRNDRSRTLRSVEKVKKRRSQINHKS